MKVRAKSFFSFFKKQKLTYVQQKTQPRVGFFFLIFQTSFQLKNQSKICFKIQKKNEREIGPLSIIFRA